MLVLSVIWITSHSCSVTRNKVYSRAWLICWWN